jgi:hypothetical protein
VIDGRTELLFQDEWCFIGADGEFFGLAWRFVVAIAAMGLWDGYSVQVMAFARCYSGESVLQQRYGKPS